MPVEDITMSQRQHGMLNIKSGPTRVSLSYKSLPFAKRGKAWVDTLHFCQELTEYSKLLALID